MALTAASPRLLNVFGAYSEVACGSVDGSGGTSSVTVPQLSSIQGVIVTGATSTTAVYVATISGNTFTATHASGDDFHWMAWGNAKA